MQDLSGYTDGTIVKPSEGASVSKWVVNNAKIKTWIMKSVEGYIAANLSPLSIAKHLQAKQ